MESEELDLDLSTRGALEMMTEEGIHGNTSVDDTGQHHPSTGGDTMSKTPLDNDISTINTAMGCLMMFSGMGMLGTGVVINGFLAFRSSRGLHGPGPHIWWTGIMPFMLGMAVTYSAVKRNRRQMYMWCTILIVALFAQVSLMGVIGNFSTSHYDVYPLRGYRNGHPICVKFWSNCYCQDYFHGIYSELEVPGFHYVHEGDIKWRQTSFRSCHDVHLISRLYFSLMACLAVYILVALFAVILGYYGTICAKENVKFKRLAEDTDIPDMDAVPSRIQDSEQGQDRDLGTIESNDVEGQPSGLDPSILLHHDDGRTNDRLLNAHL